VSKSPSRLRLGIRELQLGLSLGVVAVILHAFVTSTLLLHWTPPPIASEFGYLLVRALAGRGDLLIIGPLLSAGAAYAFGVSPVSSALGSVGLVEATMVFMHWARGGFDETEQPLAYLVPFWMVSIFAGIVSYLAGQWGARRARRVAPAQPTAGTSLPPSSDFAEQMRAAQARARPEAAGTPASPTPDGAAPIDKPPPPTTSS
jgi:hypothetical protein